MRLSSISRRRFLADASSLALCAASVPELLAVAADNSPATPSSDDFAASLADAPKRLRRSESFLGVHFDFHANEGDQNIGANTTPEMIQTIIDEIKPDYIQTDCKGHRGFSSYPTKVGNPAPGIVADALKVWRSTTAKNGVALYMHYSGVWDKAALEKRPDWASVSNPEGARSGEMTSVFGGYREGLLVPQLLELANDYGVDGAWVDGECWATQVNYCDEAKKLFLEETGRQTVPTGPGQEGWADWKNFHREAFRRYLRAYLTEVREKAPSFQVASNWAFTDHMPEPVSAPVEYISGDYSRNDSVNSARYSARFMAAQNIPWDLMAWSFADRADGKGWSQKPGPQLCREAACVLAMGGGFQAYITQERDGSVNLEKIKPMAEAAKFCRARQALSHRSKPIPQIALFCPTESHYDYFDSVGGQLFPMITWQRPILQRLLEANYSVEIFATAALCEKMADYPLVVLFRPHILPPELKAKVAEYVRGGGSVLMIGNEPINAAADVLADGETVDVEKRDGGWLLRECKLGAGRFALLPTPEGRHAEVVAATGAPFAELLQVALRRLFPEPLVEFAAPQPLDVTVARAPDGRLTVHLVNVSGPHAQAGLIDKIDPVVNIETTLRLAERPKKLRLEPSGVDLAFDWADGAAKFAVPSVPLHEIIVVD
ncbi:MAG: hypothetical protein IJE77_11275 [Thermoguttaceae bacterium]|nr:hypothetical protein [Thermoguttaceae bacterium]